MCMNSSGQTGITIQTNKKFKNEKEIYPYLQKYVFKKGFKFYSIVLKGLPDFVVTELTDEYKLKLSLGFYEVKYENRKLRPTQFKLLTELKKIAPVWVVRGYRDGKLYFNKF